MDISSIKEYVAPEFDRVMDLMRSSLASDIRLLDATNNSILSNGGKRLRPILSILAAKACSDETVTEDTIRFAAASELLHNATLLHDDVADDSTCRRGKPTVMSVLGGKASVLLGDYWLVKAVEKILRSDKNSLLITGIFSKTLSDLAEGEILQLQKASDGDTDEEDYRRIIYCKTASLFEAAAVSASISVGASDGQVEAIRSYAVNLGLAFQIKDDIMDYVGGEKLGKPAGQDLEEQKITMPLLGALADVSETEAATVREKICHIHEHPEYQAEIVAFVMDHGGIACAQKRLEEKIEEAVAALDILPQTKAKDCLVALARYNAERNY